MAISAVPYALQNSSHSADLFRQAVSSLVPPGGGLISAGDLAITQTGTASMNVVFGVGRAWVPGTNVGNVAGGNFSKQAMYFALNDSAFTASIATANATNPRIDVAYIAVQDSQYAGTTNTAVLGIATGVPTAGATYPANAPTIPANAIALAWINVPANAASILTANITSVAPPTLSRTSAGLQPWGAGVVTPASGYVVYPGGTYDTPSYVKDSANRVSLAGLLGTSSATISMAAGTLYTLATLPAALTPAKAKVFAVGVGPGMGYTGTVYVQPNGNIQYMPSIAFTSLTQSSFYVSLEGIGWWI